MAASGGGLPKRFGNWHTVYTRMNRWAKAGVLDRLFEELQHQQLIRVRIEAVTVSTAPSFRCIPTALAR